MSLNWNFQRGGGVQTKNNPLWGSMGIFLEQLNRRKLMQVLEIYYSCDKVFSKNNCLQIRVLIASIVVHLGDLEKSESWKSPGKLFLKKDTNPECRDQHVNSHNSFNA